MPLTSKQRQHLRALAHHLDPVATVGLAGVSDPVIEKVVEELENHELIKVRVTPEAPDDVKATADALAAGARAERVQVVGRIVVLYRRRSRKPTIQLPTAPQV
jgi:RNA-binding protein